MRDSRKPVANVRLRAAREQHGWSQEQVAANLGTNGFTVCRWERGTALPGPFYRQALCELFELSLDELGLIPAASSAKGETPSVTVPAVPLAVPYAPLALLARETVIEQVQAHLKDGASAVALSGLPGIGKTALAVALAHDAHIRANYPDGVVWVALGPQAQISTDLLACAQQVGVSISAEAHGRSPAHLSRVVHQALAHRRVLFIIDDVWNLADALHFKIGGKGCASVITTRFPGIAAQFAGARVIAIPELDDVASRQVIQRLAPALDVQESAWVRLIQYAGGLPLALVLMGNYLHSQSYSGQTRRVAAALEQLASAATRLRLAYPFAPAEQAGYPAHTTNLTLQAVIALSVDAMPEASQTLLTILAHFPAKPHSFTEDAAFAASGYSNSEFVSAFDALVDAGLVESIGSDRIALHQTLADFLRLTDPDPQAQARIVTYYVDFMQHHARNWPQLTHEIPNILAALGSAYDIGLTRAFVQGVIALGDYFVEQALFVEAHHLLTQALDITRRLQADVDRAQVLLHLARIADRQGNYAQGHAAVTEGLAVVGRDPKHVALRCDLLHIQGLIARRQGEYAAAEAAYNAGLIAAQAAHLLVPKLWLARGSLHLRRGEFTQAETCYLTGRDQAQTLQLPGAECAFLQSLGALAGERCAYRQARTYYEQALQLADAQTMRESQCGIRANLCQLALTQDDLTQAQQLAQEGLSLARQYACNERLITLLLRAGEIAFRQGDVVVAAEYLVEGLALARAAGQKDRISLLLLPMGQLLAYQGDADTANQHFAEALALARSLGLTAHVAMVRLAQVDLALANHMTGTLQELVDEALEIGAQLASDEITALANFAHAQLLLAVHQDRDARARGEQSYTLLCELDHYRRAAVRHWLDTHCVDPVLPTSGTVALSLAQ